MMSNHDFALQAPKDVIRFPAFWLRERWLFTVSCIILTVGLCLGFLALVTENYLVWLPPIAIHSLAIWGVILASKILAMLIVSIEIADRVDEHAASDLRRIEGGALSRPSLDALGARYLPQNPEREIDILRLFEHILREAKDRRFSPPFSLMQPFREGAFAGLSRLQSLQRIALQVGILGTFVGLLFALSHLTPTAGRQLNPEDLQGLLNNLGVAFSTSIAGIEVAILLKLLALIVQQRQQEYFRSMEEATVGLTSMARNSINNDAYLAELNEVQTAVRQVSDRILHQSDRIAAQTNALQQGMGDLAEAREHLDSFLGQVQDDQKLLLTELRDIYQTLSPERLTQRLETALENSNRNLVGNLQRNLQALLQQFNELLTPLSHMEGMVSTVTRIGSDSLAQTQILQTSLAGSYEQLAEIVSRLESRWTSTLEVVEATRSTSTLADPSTTLIPTHTTLQKLLQTTLATQRNSSQVHQQLVEAMASLQDGILDLPIERRLLKMFVNTLNFASKIARKLSRKTLRLWRR